MPEHKITSLQISDSSRSSLHSCARKLEFRKFYHHSRREESLPADAGSALHAAFQNWLIYKDLEQAVFTLQMTYPIHLLSNPMADRSLEACYATLLAMTEANMGEYELAYIEHNGILKPAIEVPFEIRFTGFNLSGESADSADSAAAACPVSYIGFIDAVYHNNFDKSFIVCDIKTHRNKMSDLTALYKYQDQCLPYALILERAMNQPIDNLVVKYFSCYVDVFEPRVATYDFIKSKTDIDDWTRGIALDLQLLRLYYQTDWFPRNGKSCTNFNRVCSHFDYCSSRDHETIEKMLAFERQTNGFTATSRQPVEPWIIIDLEIAE
jgi:hypothetical protein